MPPPVIGVSAHQPRHYEAGKDKGEATSGCGQTSRQAPVAGPEPAGQQSHHRSKRCSRAHPHQTGSQQHQWVGLGESQQDHSAAGSNRPDADDEPATVAGRQGTRYEGAAHADHGHHGDHEPSLGVGDP